MSQNDILGILQNAIYTVIVAAAPVLLVAVAVGLIVSIFQATTQINEQTLAFVPKIVAVLLSILLFGAHIFNTVGAFVTQLFQSINGIIG